MSYFPSIGFHSGTGSGPRGTKFVQYLTAQKKSIPNLTAAQIFVSSPKSFAHCVWSDETCAEVKSASRSLDIRLFIHAPYLINPCSWCGRTSDPQPESVNRIVDLVADLLSVGAAIGAEGVVIHVGKSLTHGEIEGVERMRAFIKAVMAKCSGPVTRLLIETCAGQGTEVLRDLTHFGTFVKSLVEEFGHERIGACVDTCHVYACGYTMDSLCDIMESSLGWDNIHLVHLNDSSTECGSHVDRHACIDKGHIGASALGRFCCAVADIAPHVAFVLETPCVDEAQYATEMDWFVDLFET